MAKVEDTVIINIENDGSNITNQIEVVMNIDNNETNTPNQNEDKVIFKDFMKELYIPYLSYQPAYQKDPLPA